MKKFVIFCCALLSSVRAFAYYDDFGYSSHSDEMSDFAIFTLIVMITYIIISIVILIRWWKMTTNVEQIRQHITHANPKLTYLVAIGEKEQAQRAALTLIVNKLYPIYWADGNLNPAKAESMDKELSAILPKIKKLGLEIPEYVTSGKKFIDYINELTGGNVPYSNDAYTYSPKQP